MADITTNIVIDCQIQTTAKSFPALTMIDDTQKNIAEYLPVWEGSNVYDGINFPKIDRNGVISGTVKIQNQIAAFNRVCLYFRKTGQLIASTFTDEAGDFEFHCGLNRNVSDYFVVALTDQPYNAQVFDKITPA
jgi:hypothetical protein